MVSEIRSLLGRDERILCEILAATFFAQDCDRPAGAISQTTVEVARRHRVLQHLPSDPRNSLLVPGIRAQVLAARSKCRSRLERERTAYCTLLPIVAQMDVTPLLMKGFALSDNVYPADFERWSSDLDVVIDGDRWQEVIDHLFSASHIALRNQRNGHLQRRVAERRRGSEGLEATVGSFPVDLHCGTGMLRIGPGDRVIGACHCSHGVCCSYFFPREALLLVYLSLHARKHLWARLQWVLDIALLSVKCTQGDFERAFDVAYELHSDRALTVSLILARELLGVPLPPDVLERLYSNKRTVLCAQRASVRMFRADTRRWEALRNLRLHLSIEQGGLAKVKYLVRRIFLPTYSDIGQIAHDGASFSEAVIGRGRRLFAAVLKNKVSIAKCSTKHTADRVTNIR